MRIEYNIANALRKYEKEQYPTYLNYVESLIKLFTPQSMTKDKMGLLAIVILSMDLSNHEKQADHINIFEKMIDKGFYISNQEEVLDINNDFEIIYNILLKNKKEELFFKLFKDVNDVIALPLILKKKIYENANIEPGLIKTSDILKTLFKYHFVSSPVYYKNNYMNNYCDFLSQVIYNLHKKNTDNTFMSQIKSQQGVEAFFYHFGIVVKDKKNIYIHPDNYSKCAGYKEWVMLIQSVEKKILSDVIDNKDNLLKKKRL